MGRAIAEMFGAEGAALALLDLNDEGVRAVAIELHLKLLAPDAGMQNCLLAKHAHV
jgi:NAD(P)-dependent dehydrogenase (short-subunit alcohol dehydrogenase family)